MSWVKIFSSSTNVIFSFDLILSEKKRFDSLPEFLKNQQRNFHLELLNIVFCLLLKILAQ